MKLRVICMMLVASFFLVACGSDAENKETEALPENEDIKAFVDDYSTGTFENVQASITSTELIVQDQNQVEKTYDLPADEFFVSIAPFVEQTHACDIHSLTGCQGEMIEEDFDVYIEDEDGNVIVDEQMTSYANGFIDLWLPRDQTFQVKITHEGKEVASDLQTYEDSGTCITTFQLL